MANHDITTDAAVRDIAEFTIPGHVIFWGDVRETLAGYIPDHSVDLVFADPPYNIGKTFSGFHDKWPSEQEYAEWAYSWLDECVRVLKPTGSLYVMTSTQAMPYFDLYLRSRLHVRGRIVWSYDSSGVQARNSFGSLYEPILYCVADDKSYCFNSDDVLVEAKTGARRNLIDYRGGTPKPYNTTKVPGNVWCFPRVRYRMEEYEEHPSQKPEALLERIIRASSNAGDTVLDLFSGTFSTAAVAKRLGRNTVSIEMQEQYVKTGLRRIFGQREYKGEALAPPRKNTARKNGGGNGRVASLSGGLFDAI